MSIVKLTCTDIDKELTPEEQVELEAATKLTPNFDEDSPEMTNEMLLQFRRLRIAKSND
ncbi:MAG: hypothetical protein IJ091_05030 [Oscillospiraceae bacterium]|nr:hypothetical protein [Oscillospiraceae bacterium]